MEPKRVLQVLSAMHRAGAETMIMNLYRNVNRDVVQFDFLLKEPVKNGYEEEIRALGGRIFYVESAKKTGLVRYILEQIRAMRENGPYIAVHSHMNIFSGLIMLSAFFAGVKIRIAHSHNTHFPYSKNAQKVLKGLINTFATKRIACGEDAGRALFGKRSFTVLPNGIDVDKYLPLGVEEKTRLRQKLGFSPNKIQICHVGRFEKVKNHKFILDMASMLRDEKCEFEIHFLGGGDLFEEIQACAKEKRLTEVFFHGSVNNVNEYLRATDFLVLPSLYEGLPVTLVEGQCAGVHCLVSDNVTHEVDFEIGLMEYLPLEVKRWADRIKSFDVNQSAITNNKISEAAGAKGYSAKDNVKRLMKLYEVY